MKPIDWIIIIAAALIVAGVIGYSLWRKKKGKNVGCGCGCANCPSANSCQSAKKD